MFHRTPDTELSPILSILADTECCPLISILFSLIIIETDIYLDNWMPRQKLFLSLPNSWM